MVVHPAPARLTERARRSFAGRAAPIVVLALGLVFVAASLNRLDAIYANDPGIFRTRQLAPQPISAAHSTAVPLLDLLHDQFAKSHFGRQLCAAVQLGRLCERRRSLPTDDAGKRKLETYARRRFGPRALDMTVTSWQERPKKIVAVAVARYENERAARRALRESRARRVVVTPRGFSGKPLARIAWLEGNRFLVGLAVTAATRQAAVQELQASRRDVRAYVGTSRLAAYEAIALGPLLLLLAALFSARIIAAVAITVVVIISSLAAIAVALVGLLLYLPIALVRGRRRRARSAARHTEQPTFGTSARVHDLEPEIKSLAAENRAVLLGLAGLVGFGIAALTTSLFPESLVWGSLLVVASYSPKTVRSDRGKRLIMFGRKAVRIILAVTFIGLFLGLTPIGLLSDLRFQILAIAVGVVILVEHWRGLITETAVGYAKWYEDIDARSTVFLVGVGLLTVGAASLLLASTGDRDVRAHAVEKLAGLVGLLIASVAAAHVRAARDAAARERARRRETPYVLYLRSFGDDRLRVSSPLLERRGLERLSWRRTELFEDVITRGLSTIGPVVAIARPGTGQRDLGAARDSIVVDDWLTAVKSYMSNALLVAVVMGTSEGLVRELETLGELGLLNRICVFVPPVDDEDLAQRMEVLERQRQYAALWGDPGGEQDLRERIVALTSYRGKRAVLTASKRTASAYRAVGADLQE